MMGRLYLIPAIAGLLIVGGLPGLSSVALANHAFTLDSAEIRGNGELRVKGHVPQRGDTVAIRILDQNGAAVSTANQGSKGTNWTFKEKPAPTPACVAEASLAGTTLTRDIANRPAECEQQQNNPPVCSIDTPATDVTITVGGTVNYSGTVTDPDAGDTVTISWVFNGGAPANSGAEDPGNVTYNATGTFTTTLDATDNSGAPNAACVQQTRTITVDQQQGNLITEPVMQQDFINNGFRVLAANDLGMHCADQDYRIWSILPPFNVVHAQVIERGNNPTLVTATTHPNMSVLYSAASNPLDPIFDPSNPTLPPSLNTPAAALVGTPRAAISINSTSQNDAAAGIFKINFWDNNPASGNPLGFDAYDNIFFGLLSPAAVVADTGLPVPDSVLLPGCLANPASCGFGQQEMPGIANPYVDNVPKHFDRFDEDFNFFSSVLPPPLGSVIQGVNWFAADGIPVMQNDDAGRLNAYPLMRTQAVDGIDVVASTDVVLPVASEADCQNCHVDPIDCADPDLPQLIQSDSCNGAAVTVTEFSGISFDVSTIETAPGDTVEQNLLNAAKINIVRLHDVKHGAGYPIGWGSCDAAANPTDVTQWNANCLENRVPISCAQCHYSPALDLAQLGPTDDLVNQVFQATVFHTMSSVMHGHHGQFASLFPDMPAPDEPRDTQTILEQTCYQCHPGKRTQCLRGVMSAGGVVCQDCHGQMADVGDDFTTGGTRVPWASEPGCQSCHTGDAKTLNHPPGAIVAPDGIRLLQAYVGNDANAPIQSPTSRFAENESLYRLSGNEVTAAADQGHQGIMCEGCHNGTHAIWPVSPDNGPFLANDNVAANNLQGHSGSIIECDTCHTADLGLEQGGPHGLHQVAPISQNDGELDLNVAFTTWTEDHKQVNDSSCRSCHGNSGQGTVLSRTAADRTLLCKEDEKCDGKFMINGEEERLIFVPKGTEVSCTLCHDNKIK